MIPRQELLDTASRFGVPETQVARDHLLSHLLAALPALAEDPPVFFGGTALCRTHLLDWRLSEDLDLLVDDVRSWQQRLTVPLPSAVRRDFPGASIRWRRDGLTWAGVLAVDSLTVQLQLVARDASYRRYPVAPAAVALRYSDVPASVELPVPTLPAAVAMKLNAWAERRAPRDLADLYALADRDAVTRATVELARDVSHALGPWSFHDRHRPAEEPWQTALRAQMRTVPDLQSAFETVRSAVAAAAAW